MYGKINSIILSIFLFITIIFNLFGQENAVHKISTKELSHRMLDFNQHILQEGLDAYILSTQLGIFYLTGINYYPMERPFLLIFVPKIKKQILLVPLMEKSHFEKDLKEVGLNILPNDIITYLGYPAPKGERWNDKVSEIVTSLNLKNIGIEEEINSKILDELIDLGPDVSIQKNPIIKQMRLIKSAEEIELMIRANLHSAISLNNLLSEAYDGITIAQLFKVGKTYTNERLFTTLHDNNIRPNVLSTKTLAAAWPAPHSAHPHYIPYLDDVLSKGPHIAFSFVTYESYYGECERTFFLVPPDELEIEAFNAMMESRKAAIAQLDRLKNGESVYTQEVHEAADAILRLAAADFGGEVLHRTGHGIGLEHHEAPFFAKANSKIYEEDQSFIEENETSTGKHVIGIEGREIIAVNEGYGVTLKPGMFLSIEPGLYIPDIGGFRHSDIFFITKDGYKNLTDLAPTDLEDLVITESKYTKKAMGEVIKHSLHID
ncbi:MAG: M24 family metallopeptidase [Pseudomonadota bacterium]